MYINQGYKWYPSHTDAGQGERGLMLHVAKRIGICEYAPGGIIMDTVREEVTSHKKQTRRDARYRNNVRDKVQNRKKSV